ncbi:hypothetical protein EDB83DRAFT_2313926 [Lactarius deliciosus]|nr:hypothetical protein EDB83DRAFT_2313926 [Lactarius deliciosus]
MSVVLRLCWRKARRGRAQGRRFRWVRGESLKSAARTIMAASGEASEADDIEDSSMLGRKYFGMVTRTPFRTQPVRLMWTKGAPCFGFCCKGRRTGKVKQEWLNGLTLGRGTDGQGEGVEEVSGVETARDDAGLLSSKTGWTRPSTVAGRTTVTVDIDRGLSANLEGTDKTRLKPPDIEITSLDERMFDLFKFREFIDRLLEVQMNIVKQIFYPLSALSPSP